MAADEYSLFCGRNVGLGRRGTDVVVGFRLEARE